MAVVRVLFFSGSAPPSCRDVYRLRCRCDRSSPFNQYTPGTPHPAGRLQVVIRHPQSVLVCFLCCGLPVRGPSGGGGCSSCNLSSTAVVAATLCHQPRRLSADSSFQLCNWARVVLRSRRERHGHGTVPLLSAARRVKHVKHAGCMARGRSSWPSTPSSDTFVLKPALCAVFISLVR